QARRRPAPPPRHRHRPRGDDPQRPAGDRRRVRPRGAAAGLALARPAAGRGPAGPAGRAATLPPGRGTPPRVWPPPHFAQELLEVRARPPRREGGVLLQAGGVLEPLLDRPPQQLHRLLAVGLGQLLALLLGQLVVLFRQRDAAGQ